VMDGVVSPGKSVPGVVDGVETVLSLPVVPPAEQPSTSSPPFNANANAEFRFIMAKAPPRMGTEIRPRR
jgi:hypothetical protein